MRSTYETMDESRPLSVGGEFGYEYGLFGEVLRKTGAASGQPFHFSTKYQDDETGLLYYGYRYYQPSTGRWLSRDPLEELGGNNLYVFAGNAPTCRIDSLGLTPWDWIPLIGTWLASRDKPKGSKSSDYSYTMPCPCDIFDVTPCELAIDSKAFHYTVVANAPGALGIALDAVAAFISVGKGLPLTIVSAVLTVDGVVKAKITIDNVNLIKKGAEAAKKEKCKCE